MLILTPVQVSVEVSQYSPKLQEAICVSELQSERITPIIMGLKRQEKARLKNEEYMEDETNTNRDKIFKRDYFLH